jgi:hypothetical protein
MLAVLCLCSGIAAANRLPAWAYTWVAADVIGLVGALNLVAEDRTFVFSPIADIVVLALFLLAGLTSLSAVALRGWQHSGLLALGVSGALSLSLCFWAAAGPFRVDLGLLAAPAGLLLAAATYAYMRGPAVTRIAALVAAGITAAGLSWAVDRAFQSWEPFFGAPKLFWPMLALSSGPLVIGPLLGLAARRMRLALTRPRREE